VLLRPPYGALNKPEHVWIPQRLKLNVIYWSVDTLDWKHPGAATITQRVLAGARPGAIIFQHGRGTLRPAVVAVLKESGKPLKTAGIYDALVARGYKFTFKEAKKILGIRLYKMLGVQPLGEGLFKAK
jgi:peptidoglycan/xylan/chitin deacetylase (PgdA/CDA1 family)